MKLTDYHPPAALLTGHRILITGASSGIGRAAALSFAAHGAELALLSRRAELLESLAEEITAAGGRPPLVCKMDLLSTRGADYCELSDSLQHRFGALDGLLHCAALTGIPTPIAHTDVLSWYQTMQVNVHAAFLLIRELLPLAEAAPGASIVLSSADVAHRGQAYWGAYSVSKFALHGLMQVLAAELENTSKVRVNSIDPGAVDTPLRRTLMPAENPTENPPPEAVMAPYLYLLGRDSKGQTGKAFRIDD